MENKSLKYWKVFAVVLVALNITLIIFLLAGPHPGRQPGNRDGNGPGNYLTGKLKFSDAQKSEFAKLRDEHRSKINQLQSEGKDLREGFFNGLKSDPVMIPADSITEKIAKNQKAMELATYEHFKAVKNLCTPEQKIIFNEIIQEVIGNMGNQQPGQGRRCKNGIN